ncbi:MAG: hypothetical protein ACXW4T_07885 [Candidatus Limnocylindrales bacterium]
MIGTSRGKAIGRRDANRRGEQLPIGEADANIFNCPRCARPLGAGTSRCPGCGSRLVAGVRLGRAIGFVAIGFLVGSALGGGTVAAVTVLTRPAAGADVQVPPVVSPSAAPIATAQPAPTTRPAPVDPTIPSAALSALRQSAVVNQRLLTDTERLTAVLKAKWPTGKDIAPILRSLAATAGFGDQAAPDIAAWADGAAVSQDYVTFYAAIGGAADDGLAASLSNNRAYVDAARRMMKIIGGITDLDAAARALAATANLELAPLQPSR